MAMKEWFRQMQPVQLYLMLALTIIFFIVELVMSHMTHSLTLLVEAYHMLCNVIALIGYIITIKYGSANVDRDEDVSSRVSMNGEMVPTGNISASTCYIHTPAPGCAQHHHHHHNHASSSEEKKLKNTFGWARVDVLVMLIDCVFLFSLCFSNTVEAIQTLLHIDHHDEMHHPIPVMCIGAATFLLNGFCFLLIGGYTHHQGSFLHITPSGDVVLDRHITQNSPQKGEQRVSIEPNSPASTSQYRYNQNNIFREVLRDNLGSLLVIVCSLIVFFTDEEVAKFVDPIFSIISVVSLLSLSIPYMKESASILLQTIPATINIDSLRSELLKAFPDIVNVHDLHIWALTATKVFSTAHIIFLNSKDYVRIRKEVTEFFHDQGITQVTIQPEFFKMDNKSSLTEIPNINSNHCLVMCRELGCHSRHCCSQNDQELVKVTVGSNSHHHHGHSHHHNKNHKKNHVATRVKELVTNKKPKNDNHTNPSPGCKINRSFENSSEDEFSCDNSVGSATNSNMGSNGMINSTSEDVDQNEDPASYKAGKNINKNIHNLSRQSSIEGDDKNAAAEPNNEINKTEKDIPLDENNSDTCALTCQKAQSQESQLPRDHESERSESDNIGVHNSTTVPSEINISESVLSRKVTESESVSKAMIHEHINPSVT